MIKETSERRHHWLVLEACFILVGIIVGGSNFVSVSRRRLQDVVVDSEGVDGRAVLRRARIS